MAYADLTYEAQLKFLCTRKVNIEILSSDTEGGQIRYNNYDNGTSVGKKKKKNDTINQLIFHLLHIFQCIKFITLSNSRRSLQAKLSFSKETPLIIVLNFTNIRIMYGGLTVLLSSNNSSYFHSSMQSQDIVVVQNVLI